MTNRNGRRRRNAWIASTPATATIVGLALTLASALGGGCASEPPPVPERRPPRAKAPPRDLDAEADRQRPPKPAAPIDTPEVIAAKLGVEPSQLQWSPGHKSYAAAVPPKDPGATPAATYKLAAYSAAGERLIEVDGARPGVVADLRFMGEDRLIYRVTPWPPPPAAKHGKRGKAPKRAKQAKQAKQAKRGGKPKPKSPPRAPTTLYVIQPLAADAAPIVCEGRRFTFSPKGDHVAWVAGEPGQELVGADGAQVYPRSGVTAIPGEPAWSRDGGSLAVIEGGPAPKLVVLVEVDNPSGDNSWPLPPEAAGPTLPTLRVFWAGAGRIVVGHDVTKPVFATSFVREAAPLVTPPGEETPAPAEAESP
jgi:hypothetical protein